MTNPFPTITSGRHPFEVGCFACAVFVGLWGLFVPGGTSTSIDKAFPSALVSTFYAFMLVFGLASLGAVLLVPDQDRRLRLERLCCFGVGWGALTYVAAAMYATGLAAGTAAMPWFWVAIVCTWRFFQIRYERRVVRDLDRDVDTSSLRATLDQREPS